MQTNMPKRNEAYVFIHLDGKWLPCGYLTIEEDNRKIHSTFQYGKKYLQRENAISIDPVQLPLGHSLFRSVPKSPLFGGIRDAAPDGWGRHLLDRAAAPLSPGEFEYLTAFALEDRIGALGFGSSIEHGPGPIHPGWANYPPHGAELDLENMIAAADQIETAAAISPEYRRFLVRGSSLGGAQPKAPTQHEGRMWIAKFGRQYEAWNTCRIENANMHLARICGITVPESKTLTVAGRDVFLISRFDRDPSGNRIPFITAATLLETDQVDEGAYQDIAVQMRRYCAAATIYEDLKQLFKRLIFNILCNNSDDHLRNHGFIHTHGGWRLSPAYDIVPQPDMGPKVPRLLTLGVGMNGSRTATLQNALSSCGVFGLAEADGRKLIDQMKKKFFSEWEQIYLRYNVPLKDLPALAEAFVNHI
jgi:serine/threonine-protein kinase HipA